MKGAVSGTDSFYLVQLGQEAYLGGILFLLREALHVGLFLWGVLPQHVHEPVSGFYFLWVIGAPDVTLHAHELAAQLNVSPIHFLRRPEPGGRAIPHVGRSGLLEHPLLAQDTQYLVPENRIFVVDPVLRLPGLVAIAPQLDPLVLLQLALPLGVLPDCLAADLLPLLVDSLQVTPVLVVLGLEQQHPIQGCVSDFMLAMLQAKVLGHQFYCILIMIGMIK